MASAPTAPSAPEVSPFRARLLGGLAASIAERGYRDTTVADIVRHARTSKRTFYDEFAGKQECFVALLVDDVAQMIAGIRAAVDPEADWREQVRRAVGAYVDHIAARPAITLAWIRDLPALGEVVRTMEPVTMHDVTEMLIELSSGPGFRRAGLAPLSRPMAVFLAGGLRELAARFVEEGRDLRELTAPAVAAATAVLRG